MINWFNMPEEGLSNGGEFEIKELTATENKVYQKDGEVYNKVTVNVEGGGGSSDFSTAEVAVNIADSVILYMPHIYDEGDVVDAESEIITNGNYIAILYKGSCYAVASGNYGTVTVSGNIVADDGEITISGNGTITITAGE